MAPSTVAALSYAGLAEARNIPGGYARLLNPEPIVVYSTPALVEEGNVMTVDVSSCVVSNLMDLGTSDKFNEQ